MFIAVNDLLFATRIEGAAQRAGYEPASAAGGLPDRSALDGAIVVVDLHDALLDAESVIRQATAAGARVLAFGRHTEPGTLRRARDAGADLVVPRSQIAEELPALFDALAQASQEPQPT